ncbi:MAG: ABC transporter ATP-binding protein [Dethiobacteria bacterium]
MIEFQDVTKVFENAQEPAVKNLQIQIYEGEIVVLVGPSGCGKTTTMKMINRLVDPTEGKIILDNQDVSKVDPLELRRNIGYVIQHIGLFPHLTVEENIATVPKLKKWSKEAIAERVNELLKLVGMESEIVKQKMPRQLSGGQQQRIGVARAMAADPPIMLMDEPFGALDPITRERLQNEFLGIQQDVRKTIVFVTHDIDEAVKMGDRIAVMRDGEVVQYDTPNAILSTPADQFIANLTGEDRAIKYLSLVDVSRAFIQYDDLKKSRGTNKCIDHNASLKEALIVMLENGLLQLDVRKHKDVIGYISLQKMVEVVSSKKL